MTPKKPAGPKRVGFGARLEARFEPRLHWGAEFLEDKVRLCAVSMNPGGKITVDKTFEGSYAEAEAFARAQGLESEGLHAAVSHLPFKISIVEPGAAEDDAL